MRHTLLLGTLFLSACVSIAARDEPALIVDPDQESHAEIVRAVSDALQVANVTIAPDALTRDSSLLIERAPARDPEGRRLNGRDLDKPEQFRLVKHGDQCVLVHARSGARTILARTKCRAED